MKKMCMNIIRVLLLGVASGVLYCSIELLYRGYTHISMFILAMILGVFVIDPINNIFGFSMDYLAQVSIATFFCTLAEGFCGMIVNVQMGLHVWDYSNLPEWTRFFYGQCDIIFVLAWFLIIGCVGIFYCDAFNYYVMHSGEQPYYVICGREFFRFPLCKDNDTHHEMWKGL